MSRNISDEFEKAFGGSSGPSTDSGVGQRMLGSFLSWMQEKTKPVFLVATCNDISRLPPELLRKGRWDDIFFVDLPNEEERRAIFNIHLEKRKRDPRNFDIETLVMMSANHSGAEIEGSIIDAMYKSFSEDREVSDEDLQNSVKMTVPLAVLREDEISALRKWAKQRARPTTSPPKKLEGARGRRRTKA